MCVILKARWQSETLSEHKSVSYFQPSWVRKQNKKKTQASVSEKKKKKNTLLFLHTPQSPHSLYAWLAASYYLQVSRAISKQCVIYSPFFSPLYVCNVRRRRGRQPDCRCPLADALRTVLCLPSVSVTLSLSLPVFKHRASSSCLALYRVWRFF